MGKNMENKCFTLEISWSLKQPVQNWEKYLKSIWKVGNFFRTLIGRITKTDNLYFD